MPGETQGPMIAAMRARARFPLIIGMGLVMQVACVSSDLAAPTIPAGAIVYVMNAKYLPLLSYRFVDTSSAQYLVQTAVTAPDTGVFLGMNCIGLSPKAFGDTTGTFVFAKVGNNFIALREVKGKPPDTTVDTIPASFLPPTTEGTQGSYVVNSAGALTLTWTDGTPTQYFDPSATIILHGDTISSHAELSAKADSVHASWRVSWVRDLCPQ